MAPRLFAVQEYHDRVGRVREHLNRAGLPALLAVGRGGGAVDRFGHVFYLTEAYSSFPTIPDRPGTWADRGYCACLVTADRVVVFGDPDTAVADAVCADDVATGFDTVSLVADAVRAAGLGESAVGLAGADTMTWRQAHRLHEALPRLELRDFDEQLLAIRSVKSPAEIDAMRASGEVLLAAMTAAMEQARPGASEADAAAAAAAEIARRGAAMANAFTGLGPGRAGAANPHQQTPPYAADSVMHAGDLFTIDVSGALNGYFFDMARSKVVDAEPTRVQRHVFELARSTVDAVANALRPGVTIGDATKAGLAVLDDAGYDMFADPHWHALGHSLGLAFEPPYLCPGDPTIVEAGMVIAVERHCTVAGASATYERNLVVDGDGAHDLVTVPDFWP